MNEGRAAHPRVPARGLRRGGRARRVPGPCAGAAGGPHRALPGRRPRPTAVAHQAVGRAARSRRCGCSPPTCRWRTRWPAPTWCTRTPGTPTSPGTSRRCCYGIPHVATVHSLEPLRPWKAEQLGGGYALSSWAERVSAQRRGGGGGGLRRHAGRRAVGLPGDHRRNGSRVIRNGIDTAEYAPDPGTDVLEKHGVDPARPYVIFVGRITRQKGVPVLLRAAAALDPSAQLVLCAGAADTRGARRRGRRRLWPGCRRRGPGCSGSRRCCPSRRSSSCSRTRSSSSARRCTSRSASSTWRRWRAGPPWWRRGSAASPRWSTTA